MNSPIGEDDLAAWVDRRLSTERLRAVEAYLAVHPQVAERLQEQRRHSAALAAAFAPITAEPIPASMRIEGLATRRFSNSGWRQVVAASLLLAAGFGGGWSMRSSTLPPRAGIGALAREASYSYRVYASDDRRPAELGPGNRRELVSWATRRMGSTPTIPDLRSAGYSFAGGRLVATPHGPALMLIYDSASSARLAILTRPMEIDKDAKMVVAAESDVQLVSWADNGVGYSIVAPASGALRPLAESVRKQISES